MTTTIYLMRHGESTVNVKRILTGNSYEGDLTELGREQVAQAGRWLADKGITHIRHSPFHRAQQSAEIVGAALGIPITEDPDLSEMNCGDLHGRSDDEAWSLFMSVFVRWLQGEPDARYPGGESYAEGTARMRRALASVPRDSTTLLVTHGGIVGSVVPYLCVNAAALQRTDDFPNTAFVVLEPYDDGSPIGALGERYNCLSWNLHDHLM
jgi:probable phosphoglycerate mutase